MESKKFGLMLFRLTLEIEIKLRICVQCHMGLAAAIWLKWAGE